MIKYRHISFQNSVHFSEEQDKSKCRSIDNKLFNILLMREQGRDCVSGVFGMLRASEGHKMMMMRWMCLHTWEQVDSCLVKLKVNRASIRTC